MGVYVGVKWFVKCIFVLLHVMYEHDGEVYRFVWTCILSVCTCMCVCICV